MKRFWTEEEVNFLKITYPDCYTIEVAKSLNRTERSVYGKAQLMGLKKSPAFEAMDREVRSRTLNIKGLPNQFPKGHKPWNTGKKMPKRVKEKIKHTFFSKGHTPHNAKYDGYERINSDGIIEVRVKRGKFVPKQNLEWEKVNGKIPTGKFLRCVDGNRLNVDPSNWVLVDRKENMKLNSIVRFPEEVRQMITLVTKLKKQIKTHEKQD